MTPTEQAPTKETATVDWLTDLAFGGVEPDSDKLLAAAKLIDSRAQAFSKVTRRLLKLERELERLATENRDQARALSGIRAIYRKHIFDKGLSEDSLDPSTLEGEVWFSLSNPEPPDTGSPN